MADDMFEVPGDRLRELSEQAAKASRVLTLDEAGLLSDLIRAVQGNAKLNYYIHGADTETPASYVLRAFTYNGGGFITSDKDDVRDVYVWCSGFTEHWFKVSDLITALDNLDGKHGFEAPIATIESR